MVIYSPYSKEVKVMEGWIDREGGTEVSEWPALAEERKYIEEGGGYGCG